MKFALVLALAPDRQSGRVLGDLVTADEAVKFVKEAINTGRAPDARFPQLVAIGINDVLRQHRFNPTAEQLAADIERFAVVMLEQTFEPITVDIGDSENPRILPVYTEKDAELVRDMLVSLRNLICEKEQHQQTVDALRANISAQDAESKKLRDDLVKASSAASEVATLQKKLDAAQEGALKLEAQAKIAAEVNHRLATLEADLAAAHAEAAKVAGLEAQLAEANAKLAKKGR